MEIETEWEEAYRATDRYEDNESGSDNSSDGIGFDEAYDALNRYEDEGEEGEGEDEEGDDQEEEVEEGEDEEEEDEEDEDLDEDGEGKNKKSGGTNEDGDEEPLENLTHGDKLDGPGRTCKPEKSSLKSHGRRAKVRTRPDSIF